MECSNKEGRSVSARSSLKSKKVKVALRPTLPLHLESMSCRVCSFYSSTSRSTWIKLQGLPISWCCLPTSSFVCLVSFPLSLCLARWFWPALMNGRQDHTTVVCMDTGTLPTKCLSKMSVSLCLSLTLCVALSLNLEVKNYPLIHLKKNHHFSFWATAIKFQNFIHISFLHVLTRNQICQWNNHCEKLPQSQRGESFTTLKSWVNFHRVRGVKIPLWKYREFSATRRERSFMVTYSKG